jgi:hypothetical protein
VKHATSFQLSAEAKKLLAELSIAMGLSKASVLEFAVRELSRRYKRPPPPVVENDRA